MKTSTTEYFFERRKLESLSDYHFEMAIKREKEGRINEAHNLLAHALDYEGRLMELRATCERKD